MGRKLDGQMLQYHRRTMRTVRKANRNLPGEGWKVLDLAKMIVQALAKSGSLDAILKYRRQRQEEFA